jgi:plasmid stabilization system protein ParE
VTHPLRLRSAAEQDAREAIEWYEDQLAGLGTQFLDELRHTLSRISENPRLAPEVEGTVRRGLLRRFPYAVFYVPEPDEVVILAIWHTSRDPGTWQGLA